MNLIANGCSFTAGVPQDLDPSKFIETRTKIGDFHCFGYTTPTAWPYQIEGVTPYNLAQGGSGNHRILRTTLALLDMVPQEFIDDSVFVIQWSSIFRKEYWCDNNCQWDVHNDTIEASAIVPPYSVYEPHNFDQQHEFEEKFQNKEPDVIQAWIHHKFLGLNLHQNAYESLLLITALTYALKSKNAKFMYTSLSWDNSDVFDCARPDVWNPTAYYKALQNLLPKENSIQSLSEYLNESENKYYIPDDGHPNDEGNRLFANYVKEEMEKRNWLT